MATRIWRLLLETGSRWSRNDGNLLAASMAYYAAFSFFPLLLVLLSGLGFALRFSANAQSAQEQLLDFLSRSAGSQVAGDVKSLMTQVLAQVESRATFGGPVGLLTLLLGAIGIFSQLESAFDRLWQSDVPQNRGVRAAIRNALWNRLKAFLTLVALGLLVIVALVANIILTAVGTWAEDVVLGSSLLQLVQVLFSLCLNALVLSLVYKTIPRVPVKWQHAAVGGIAVAIVWQLGSQLLSRFIVSGNYSAYGVVGSFIALMLWVYCASILLFFGAQLVQVLGHPSEQVRSPINNPE